MEDRAPVAVTLPANAGALRDKASREATSRGRKVCITDEQQLLCLRFNEQENFYVLGKKACAMGFGSARKD
ncbi:unnamed protein product [Mycetohabitans rhizoxinica HKI 454]|uniref:Uncharacterized protein n=1 Tax=Mycetohabitans rhizoxinica (strain DSM 19002 / CIP 109453 / HKI 454) TaxID=882378 RepID=E5AP62_MYCRK|nr:unnamed protein product [Mycetohabitans rhizoxinica HKI 454]